MIYILILGVAIVNAAPAAEETYSPGIKKFLESYFSHYIPGTLLQYTNISASSRISQEIKVLINNVLS